MRNRKEKKVPALKGRRACKTQPVLGRGAKAEQNQTPRTLRGGGEKSRARKMKGKTTKHGGGGTLNQIIAKKWGSKGGGG